MVSSIDERGFPSSPTTIYIEYIEFIEGNGLFQWVGSSLLSINIVKTQILNFFFLTDLLRLLDESPIYTTKSTKFFLTTISLTH